MAAEYDDPAKYAGRSYDVMALQGVRREGQTRLTQELFNDDAAGTLCTGSQKLAQRWLLEFLTRAGTMPFLTGRGCRFLSRLMQGALRNEADVRLEFAIAVSTTRQNLQNEETGDEPADERFKDAELLSLVISGTMLGLKVRIISQDPARPIILPIQIAV